MAGEFLITKWKKVFNLFDVSKDGVADDADMELFQKNFIKLYKINEVKAEDIKSEIVLFWKEFLLQGSKECTESQFTEMMGDKYSNSEEEFVQFVRKHFVTLVSLADENNDGLISKIEFRNVQKALGVKTFHDKHFNAYPHTDGHVKCEEFLESWVAFCCNNDENAIGNLEKIKLYGFRLVPDIGDTEQVVEKGDIGEKIKLTILDNARQIDSNIDDTIEI